MLLAKPAYFLPSDGQGTSYEPPWHVLVCSCVCTVYAAAPAVVPRALFMDLWSKSLGFI